MPDEVYYRESLTAHRWKAALIDLDGTLYKGNRVIEGAGEFIKRLRDQRVQPIFFTNNSTRTPEQVADKLRGMDIEAEPAEICTSSQMAAFTVRQQAGQGSIVAALGEAGLKTALQEEGLRPVMAESIAGIGSRSDARAELEPSAVVVGLNLNVTYEHLAWICGHAVRLSAWVLTNGDVRLPSSEGFLPGNGAIGAFVETATGISPQTVGKPNPAYVEFVLQRYKLQRSEAVMIGDNLLTDIACGNAAGLKTIWVQSGVNYQSQEASYKTDCGSNLRPTFSANSVAELFEK